MRSFEVPPLVAVVALNGHATGFPGRLVLVGVAASAQVIKDTRAILDLAELIRREHLHRRMGHSCRSDWPGADHQPLRPSTASVQTGLISLPLLYSMCLIRISFYFVGKSLSCDLVSSVQEACKLGETIAPTSLRSGASRALQAPLQRSARNILGGALKNTGKEQRKGRHSSEKARSECWFFVVPSQGSKARTNSTFFDGPLFDKVPRAKTVRQMDAKVGDVVVERAEKKRLL